MMLGVGAINVFVGVLLAIGNGLSRLHINLVYENHHHVIYPKDRLGIQRVKLYKGVSYFAATVLEEFNSYEVQQMAGGSRGYGSVPSQTSTIGRYIYGQCLFIGWAAMVVHILAGE